MYKEKEKKSEGMIWVKPLYSVAMDSVSCVDEIAETDEIVENVCI